MTNLTIRDNNDLCRAASLLAIYNRTTLNEKRVKRAKTVFRFNSVLKINFETTMH